MTTAGNGFGMTVSPAVVPAGQSTVTITDSGTTPLHLVTQAVSLNSKCQPTSEVSWARITPASIILRPGQHKTAHVHLSAVPAGTHQVAVMFENIGGSKGQVRVNAELGAKDTITGSGTAHSAVPCVAATAPRGDGSAFSWLPLAAGLFVLLLFGAYSAYRVGWHHKGCRHK